MEQKQSSEKSRHVESLQNCRRFVSPPLAPGKYTYTITAVTPGPNGPRTVTRRIDVRPGDLESIDLRAGQTAHNRRRI
jgi:hypothetical protein